MLELSEGGNFVSNKSTVTMQETDLWGIDQREENKFFADMREHEIMKNNEPELSNINAAAASGKSDETSPLFPSLRLLNFFLVFIGGILISTGTTTFNFTLVCMVNASYVSDDEMTANKTVPEIPENCRDPDTVSSNLSADAGLNAQDLYDGDVPWDRKIQGFVLGGYAFGMLALALPGGILLDRFGAKTMYIVNHVINAIPLLIGPFAVYYNAWYTFVLRFMAGIPSGLSWPCVMAIAARWAASSERAMLTAIGTAGFPMGSIISNIVGGQFCGLGPGGWKYAHYLWGSCCIAYIIVFALFYKDNPKDHRWISQRELSYITRHRKNRAKAQKMRVPWKALLTSPAVIAICTSTFCANWTAFMIVYFLPTYMKEVLYVKPQTNGFLSAMPYLAQFIGRLGFGTYSDKFTCFSPTISVKIFDFLTLGVPACMFLATSFLDCTMPQLAAACFALTYFFYSCNIAGYVKSTFLIAPQFVGTISGLGLTAGGISAVILPYTVGEITKNATPEQWRIAQYISAGVSLAGLLNFAVFGSGKLQKWAEPPRTSVVSLSSRDVEQPANGMHRPDIIPLALTNKVAASIDVEAVPAVFPKFTYLPTNVNHHHEA